MRIQKIRDDMTALSDKYPKGFYLPGSDNETYNCLKSELKGNLDAIQEEIVF